MLSIDKGCENVKTVEDVVALEIKSIMIGPEESR